MLVAIGGLLGVPVWILLGWLAGGLWHRHEIKQLPGLFKAKVRMVSGTYRHTSSDFPRMAGHALMAHDVLIFERGTMIPRTLHYEIAGRVQPEQPTDVSGLRGLGDSPVTMQFKLDGGEVIEVAMADEDSSLALEPLLANLPSDQVKK